MYGNSLRNYVQIAKLTLIMKTNPLILMLLLIVLSGATACKQTTREQDDKLIPALFLRKGKSEFVGCIVSIVNFLDAARAW